MLNEAETVSMTPAQGIRVKTLAAFLCYLWPGDLTHSGGESSLYLRGSFVTAVFILDNKLSRVLGGRGE